MRVLSSLALAFVASMSPALAQQPAQKPAAAKSAPEAGKKDDGKASAPQIKLEDKSVAADPSKAAERNKAGLKALDERAYADAIKAFNDAYNLGDGDGAFYLGRIVELGVGVQPDFDKARALYLAGADKGSARAMNRLGLMAFRGERMLQDYKAAAELICKAADKGDVDATFNCAGLHAEGKGVDKDLGKAIGFYEKAADKGHIGALNALGFANRDGLGVAADLVKAQSFFEKAAAKGNPVALFELGQMFENGRPMTRDLSRAHLYYNLAAARQHPAASEALQRVSAQMSADDIAKAQADAKGWKAAP